MQTIHAIFEKGVFRPLGNVDLPERSEVEFEPRLLNGKPGDLAQVYDVLSERYASGEFDVAARHNEHQP
jgi:predicted DNA-binding antitoxin AbrB/MazE fold protein